MCLHRAPSQLPTLATAVALVLLASAGCGGTSAQPRGSPPHLAAGAGGDNGGGAGVGGIGSGGSGQGGSGGVAPEPLDCSPFETLHPSWKLCSQNETSCHVVFDDRTGCAAVCAAAGLICGQVFEDEDNACAPDQTLPELGCEATGHLSDYCVCVAGEDRAPPEAPTIESAVAADGAVDLLWSPARDDVGVSGYAYRVDGGAATYVGPVHRATVTGLTNGRTYAFEVRANDAAGNTSSWSARVEATPEGTTAPPPEDALHVDKNHENCSDDRSRAANTRESPWCSMGPVGKLPVAGDLVLVHDGAYGDTNGDKIVLQMSRSGTASAPIMIRSANRWGASLEGPVAKTTHCVNFGTGTKYVVLEGFEIAGCQTGVNVNNANEHITIRGNWIHDIGRWITETAYGQSGISYGGGSDSLDIEGNLIEKVGRLEGSAHWGNHDHGIYLRNSNVRVVNNVFRDHEAGWAIHIYKSGSMKEHIEIAFNTFADPNPNRMGHIIVMPYSNDVQIHDNLFWEPSGPPIRLGSCDTITKLVYRDNATTASEGSSGGDCFSSSSGNVYDADLGLVAPASGDFHLKAGSIAIDRSSATPPSADFDGKPRPQGARADWGAFERTP